MPDSDIQIGNVVRLQSGGPDMTVMGIFGQEGVPEDVEETYRNLKNFQDGDLYCTWFTDENKKKMSGFQRSTVEKVENEA